MGAEHTPGPWFVNGISSRQTSVWARGGDVRVADCNSGAISLPGRQCDARLIAAAPELLEALQGLLDAISYPAGSPSLWNAAAEKACVAIAKGGSLTEGERAVIERRLPRDPLPTAPTEDKP